MSDRPHWLVEGIREPSQSSIVKGRSGKARSISLAEARWARLDPSGARVQSVRIAELLTMALGSAGTVPDRY